jgi:hypothetical protein
MSTASQPQAPRAHERRVRADSTTVAETELHGRAVGLPAILMQAITHIGPAIDGSSRESCSFGR